MADFYQIPIEDKNHPDYLKWEKLNFILRRMFDRLDNVDGRQSSMSFLNDLSMEGHSITKGPTQITISDDSTFVTKGYFRSTEFGKMVNSLLQASGKTPLVITGSVGTPESGGGGGGGGTSDHALLTNLGYAVAGHTGFCPAARTITATAPLTIDGGASADLSANRTIAMPVATASADGYLDKDDWSTFDGKQDALTIGDLTEATSAVLTITGGVGAVIGSGTTIEVAEAGPYQDGYLTAVDWSTFYNKQDVLTLGNLTEATSSVLTITGGTGAVVGNVTIQVAAAGSGTAGYLSSADWTTFNGKVGGSGTSGKIAKFTGTGTIGDSVIKESSSKIGISTSGAPAYPLEVTGSIKVTDASGGILPSIVTLVDAATVATDASKGNHFRITLGGNRTLGAPTNPTDGQRCIWEVVQDGTGGRTLALDTSAGGFTVGIDIPSITLSTTASMVDIIGAYYSSNLSKWIVTGFLRGYA